MQVNLKSNAMKFIEDQIKSGRFHNVDEVVSEAVNRMMTESEFALDDETVQAIHRAEDQIARGEGKDFDEFAAEWRKRIASK